jgi:predicted dehydrogenase
MKGTMPSGSAAPDDKRPVLRVGLAGTGFIADFHAAALQAIPGVELAAVCDADLQRARRFGQAWGVSDCYESLEEMLDRSGLETVHILLPPALHAEAAVACLERGRDVLVEKPMAADAGGARRILECARRTGRRVSVNHNLRFHPAVARLFDWIRRWRLGRLHHVTIAMNLPLRQLDAGQHSVWMFRTPGHIVLEQGVHPLSLVRALAGPVQRASLLVSGERRLRTGVSFYTSWQMGLECEGATASVSLSYKPGFMDAFVHVTGEDGAATADLRRNLFFASGKTRFFEPLDNLLDALRKAGQVAAGGFGNLARYASSLLLRRPASDPFSASIRAGVASFYEELRAGADPLAGAREGLEVMEICERILGLLPSPEGAAVAERNR